MSVLMNLDSIIEQGYTYSGMICPVNTTTDLVIYDPDYVPLDPDLDPPNNLPIYYNSVKTFNVYAKFVVNDGVGDKIFEKESKFVVNFNGSGVPTVNLSSAILTLNQAVVLNINYATTPTISLVFQSTRRIVLRVSVPVYITGFGVIVNGKIKIY